MLPPIPTLLGELVRRPSVNPMGRTDLAPEILYESRVTDYLEERVKSLGVPYRRWTVAPGRDNLVAHFVPPTPAPFAVIWEAHQDTVPVDGMIVDPFGAALSDGKLYGRGACDVKAGIACMLAAFGRLVAEKPPGSAAVRLAFTVDEEHTFLGIQSLVESGLRADCAIVAEPTELNIVKAHKGVARWQLETAGIACHTSRPERGTNAIYRMARIVRRIEEYANRLQLSRTDSLLGPPTMAVGMVHGGVSPNTVPDHCRIEIDRRLLPGETADGAVADLDGFLKSSPEIDFPYSVIPPRMACPALDPTGSEDLVRRLGLAIGKHEVVGVPYGTDASTLAEAGVPSVVFGPGDIAQAHTKDEWVELAEVERAADILYRFALGKS